ncbi:hypothetical protein C8J56DRAFT_1048201 [Mycena floridula]|nr:hypothetical protein C8J56DRAFT_1048201 [Mycena floridula]
MSGASLQKPPLARTFPWAMHVKQSDNLLKFASLGDRSYRTAFQHHVTQTFQLKFFSFILYGPPDALSDNLYSLANRIKTLCEIARERLPYDPHDYSLEAVGHLVNGDDVLVWSGCASGKTGIIALLAVILAQLGMESTCVIYPTNELEVDIEGKLRKLNVKAVAINADLLKTSADYLWAQAESEAMVILISPEQLQGDDFRKHLLNSKIFSSCIDTLVVDEAHLVYQ